MADDEDDDGNADMIPIANFKSNKLSQLSKKQRNENIGADDDKVDA